MTSMLADNVACAETKPKMSDLLVRRHLDAILAHLSHQTKDQRRRAMATLPAPEYRMMSTLDNLIVAGANNCHCWMMNQRRPSKDRMSRWRQRRAVGTSKRRRENIIHKLATINRSHLHSIFLFNVTTKGMKEN